MGALAADRNTQMKDGELVSFKVATGVTIFAGSLVVANSTGFAKPGAAAASLTYLGRAEETVVNAGADGAVSVLVRRKKMFKWANKAGDLVTQALVGLPCYIEDDQTVRLTAAGTSAAGTVIAVDTDGVWVE
jgi:hypothetical protein